MKRSASIRLYLLLFLSPFANVLFAQDNEQLSATILHRDSLFWQAYNTCDLEKMAGFFWDDVEFYHDKGGATFGLPALLENTKKGMCNEAGNFRLNRKAVEASVRVYRLEKEGVVYGAILSGEHVFYLTEKGKAERLDGLAKFTHVWLLKNGEWRMARVLSYDHGPAPYQGARQAITLPAAIMQTYTGKYKGPQSGIVEVQVDNGLLTLLVNGRALTIYAEKEDLFFSKERDLTFEFVKKRDAATRLIVKENDHVAEELTFMQ